MITPTDQPDHQLRTHDGPGPFPWWLALIATAATGGASWLAMNAVTAIMLAAVPALLITALVLRHDRWGIAGAVLAAAIAMWPLLLAPIR